MSPPSITPGPVNVPTGAILALGEPNGNGPIEVQPPAEEHVTTVPPQSNGVAGKIAVPSKSVTAKVPTPVQSKPSPKESSNNIVYVSPGSKPVTST